MVKDKGVIITEAVMKLLTITVPCFNSEDYMENKIYHNDMIYHNDNSFISNIETNDCYFCQKCNKFPLIEFYKHLIFIKYSCACINNKKILIKDFNNQIFLSYLEAKYQKIKCITHNKNFEYFCGTFLINIGQECIDEHQYAHDVIKFKDIEIDNDKIKIIEQKIMEIKEDFNISELYNNENLFDEYSFTELLSKETKEKEFKILISIINLQYYQST